MGSTFVGVGCLAFLCQPDGLLVQLFSPPQSSSLVTFAVPLHCYHHSPQNVVSGYAQIVDVIELNHSAECQHLHRTVSFRQICNHSSASHAKKDLKPHLLLLSKREGSVMETGVCVITQLIFRSSFF